MARTSETGHASRRLGIAALGVILAACLSSFASTAETRDAALSDPGASSAPRARDPLGLEKRIVEIADRVTRSVVHVQAIVRINDRRNQATGSGFIVSADGRILTNQHVVDKAEKVEVSIPGYPAPLPARVVGTDLQTDLALLRVETQEPLSPVVLGAVDEVRVGQWVLAIGNPYGLEGTVSLGIVSAKGRNLEIPNLINDFIQTDAMIDRGSSGGPLVDLDGHVIGVNSRGQGRGIGFTIPIDTAIEVMRQIEAGGVERAWLGIGIQALNRDLASHLGIPDATGVIVSSVSSGSPAEQAGLETGDIVTGIGDGTVAAEKEEDLGRFQRQVASREPGSRTTLHLLRDGTPQSREVVLGSAPKVDPAIAETDVGFHVQEITERLYREARLLSREGVYVSFVARGTPAAEAGLAPGDVLERVEDQAIGTLGDFDEAMRTVADADRFLLVARRGGDRRLLLVKRAANGSAP